MITKDDQIVVGIVGPCGSGKSTLIANLRRAKVPYHLYHIAQEHSYVVNMWQRLVHPDILIFLDASFDVTVQRKKLDWTIENYQEQHRRLSHARKYASLYLLTDNLTPQEVLDRVIQFLNSGQSV
jgi:ABC-type glutathione transport system ATPase component